MTLDALHEPVGPSQSCHQGSTCVRLSVAFETQTCIQLGLLRAPGWQGPGTYLLSTFVKILGAQEQSQPSQSNTCEVLASLD